MTFTLECTDGTVLQLSSTCNVQEYCHINPRWQYIIGSYLAVSGFWLCTPAWFSTLTVFGQQQQMILIFTVFALVSIGSYVFIQIVLFAESVEFRFRQKRDPMIPLVGDVTLH